MQTSDKEQKIAAVVVTYNRSRLLLECINALKEQDGLSGIIVVNNASTDDTKTILESMNNGSLHVIHMKENTGGAGGFHAGLLYSVKLGYSASWIMDDDAIPEKNSLRELLIGANRLNWDFGFLASNVQSEENEPMNVPVIDNRPNSTGYQDWGRFSADGLIKIKTATFVSVLIKNKTIENIGLPIKEMFIWGDDTEYTQRISKIKDSFFVSKSIVRHKRNLASALSVVTETNEKRIGWYKLLYRNNIYRIIKNKNKKEFLIFILGAIKTTFKVFITSKEKKFYRIFCIWNGIFKGFSFKPEILFPK